MTELELGSRAQGLSLRLSAGHAERERFNSQQVRLRDRVQDPFRRIIGAIQGYLRAYHMYRAEALTVREIQRLDTLSRDALEGLQKVFPYGVTYKSGTFRSFFCCEKPHSMTHWADNYATVGRIRVMLTQVTEGRMKSAVKTKARKTNNQASFGGSLLKNNMEVEAAMQFEVSFQNPNSDKRFELLGFKIKPEMQLRC